MTVRRLLAALVVVSVAASAVPIPGAVAAADDTRVVHDGETLTLQAGPGQVVRGESGLPAGTTLSVRVQATGASPFLLTASATVDADGEFRATFDLSDVPDGTSVAVVVHHDGTKLARVDARVVACTDACGTSTPASPDASLAAAGSNLTLATGEGRGVHGQTNLPPGTNLTVALKGTGASPFLLPAKARVGSDGSFRATFDLSGIPAGTPVTVDVLYNGTRLATATGRTVECTTNCGSPSDGGDPSDGEDRGYKLVGQVGLVEVTQGEVARIALPVGNRSTARLAVGTPVTSYALDLSVRDGDADGNGVVTVLIDTGRVDAGADAVSVADGADSVTVENVTLSESDRSVLDEGDYPLRLSGSASDEPAPDVGTLVVKDASLDEDGNESVVADFGFGTRNVVVRGSTPVRLPVRLDEANPVTVTVGESHDNFTLAATVHDGDGDERVVLVFHPSAAGSAAPLLTAADADDRVTVEVQRGDLRATEYDVDLYPARDVPLGGAGEQAIQNRGNARLVVAETGETPSLPHNPERAGGLPAVSVGALAVGGVLAVAGVALLTGVVDL